MGDSIREADGGVIFQSTAERGRRVAGTFVMLIGGAIGWQIVRAIAANRASTHAAWTAYVPVVLLFGGIALAFFIPGAMMLLYQQYVFVDPPNRRITDTRLYLGYRWTRSYPLPAFKRIVLARRSIQRGRVHRSAGSSARGKSYSIFVVELAPGSGKALRVATTQHEAPAREAAVRLRAITGFAVVDMIEREREREEAGLDSEEEDDDDGNSKSEG